MMIFYTNVGARLVHALATRGVLAPHPGLAGAVSRAARRPGWPGNPVTRS